MKNSPKHRGDMKHIFICIAFAVGGSFAQAEEFKVGQEVMFQNSMTTMKGLIIDVGPSGEVAIDFGNQITNLVYGRQPSTGAVSLYRRTEQYTVRSWYQYPPYILSIGQRVIYKDSATWMRGVILDLTENGFARVDFNSSITNDVYQYVNASRLAPAP